MTPWRPWCIIPTTTLHCSLWDLYLEPFPVLTFSQVIGSESQRPSELPSEAHMPGASQHLPSSPWDVYRSHRESQQGTDIPLPYPRRHPGSWAHFSSFLLAVVAVFLTVSPDQGGGEMRRRVGWDTKNMGYNIMDKLMSLEGWIGMC